MINLRRNFTSISLVRKLKTKRHNSLTQSKLKQVYSLTQSKRVLFKLQRILRTIMYHMADRLVVEVLCSEVYLWGHKDNERLVYASSW